MKYTFIFSFLLFTISCFSQTNDTLKTKTNKRPNIVSFVTKLNISNLTKDGIYLNGYVVNISYEQAKILNDKSIEVTGKVKIVKGLKKVYDRNGNEIFRQGRIKDFRYIKSPKIKILNY